MSVERAPRSRATGPAIAEQACVTLRDCHSGRPRRANRRNSKTPIDNAFISRVPTLFADGNALR
jgi:hypothetical protein